MQDIRRFFLWLSLGLICYLIFFSWAEFTAPEQPQEELSAAQSELPQTPTFSDTGLPRSERRKEGILSEDIRFQDELRGRSVLIETDLVRAAVDTNGAGIYELFLLDYPISIEQKDQSKKMLYLDGQTLYTHKGGLLAAGEDQPNHLSLYIADRSSYRLEEGESQLRVPFYWRAPNGNQFTKTFIFERGSYEIGVEYEIQTQELPWRGFYYAQLERSPEAAQAPGIGFLTTVPSYRGAAMYTQEDKYQKISFDDMRDQDLKQRTEAGWVAMLEHYFVGAVLPEQENRHEIYTNVLDDNRHIIGIKSLQPVVVDANQTQTINHGVFIGPKEQGQLKKTQVSGLELTVDYGWLTFISEPLFWLLNQIHSVVSNWGHAIILLTVLIKALFYPLSAAGYRSMAKLKKFQPRLVSLKERYKDDKQGLNKAMMELYKSEKINPLGGCLPILIQIPVFIALYWVLLESVEMRQAPFILWIKDLSVRDPYFVLPLLMGVSMFVQQFLNPAPLDKAQKYMMRSLPFVFTILFMWFPAGLVLYWLVNNVLSVLQQWYVTRQFT